MPQRKFHAEYQKEFPHGDIARTSQDARTGVLQISASDWCKSFGFAQRSG
jgi:hypothetical protein